MTFDSDSPAPPGSRRSRREADGAPALVERLAAYLERRRRSGVPMSAGEVVTVLVAMIRGGAASERGAPPGAWWLTARGRPVLVPAVDDDPASVPTRDLLAVLSEMAPPPLRPIVERTRDAVIPAAPVDAAALERLAFEAASPEPLILGPLAPVETERDAAQDAATSLLQAWDEGAPAVLRHLVARLPRRVRRGPRASRPVIASLGVVVFAAVVALGLLLWPGRAPSVDEASSAETTSSSPSAGGLAPTAPPPPAEAPAEASPPPYAGQTPEGTGSRTPPPAPSALPGDGSASDPAALDSARVLVAQYGACGGDAACEGKLRESPAAPGEDQVLSPADAVTLIDDFGGLMVVRLDRGAKRQYATLVRVNGRWLVRAAGAVTDQPS